MFSHRILLNITKGLCSLWIVYYHVLSAAQIVPFPRLNSKFFNALVDTGQTWSAIFHSIFGAMSIHAVGVFIVLSGYGLTRSLISKTQSDPSSSPIWKKWYITRFWRLYPLYWYSHLIFLVFPFVLWLEPLDWRFLLSLTGVQAWPMDSIFFYANPSWWFVWLIIQLYAVFPILFMMLQRFGRWKFLFMAVVAGFISRQLILVEFPVGASGMLCMGGFFMCRLGEFALGMFVAASTLKVKEAGKEEVTSKFSLDHLIGVGPLLTGILIYLCGLLCYSSVQLYVFVDTITTTGFFLIVLNVARGITFIPRLSRFGYFVGLVSFGMYLLHQPFAMTLGEFLRGADLIEFYSVFAIFIAFMLAFSWASQELVDFSVRQIRMLFAKMHHARIATPHRRQES